jgi:CheY-like chemotaxis protein
MDFLIRERGRAELDAVWGALASAQSMLLAAEEETLRMRGELERLRRGADSGTVTGRPCVFEGTARRLAIVDTSDAWEIPARTRAVPLLEPDAGLAERLAALAVTDVLANLASRGVLDAVAALRATGSPVRVRGCLAPPDGPDVVMLGRIEAVPGLDPDDVLPVVDRRRGRRVLMAGDDGDRLIALRTRLARAGMSVSIAWDAKQAEGLLAMLVPQLAIIDLALPPRGGHGLAVRVAAQEPAPLLVVTRSSRDDAGGFADALGDALRVRPGTPRAELLDQLLRPAAEAATAQPSLR